MKEITLSLLLILAPLCLGQKFTLGACGQLQSVAITNIFGTLDGGWRVYAISPSPFFHSWNCMFFNVAVVVANSQYSIAVNGMDKLTGRQLTAYGNIQVNGAISANSVVANSLTITFQNSRKFSSATYYILDGVVDNYLALYACENIGLGKFEHAIILTTANTTPAQLNSALGALSQKGYPQHAVKRTYVGCN